MSDDYKQPAFKKLLEKLQEESWQLELIISGFAIFGLFIAYEPISLAAKEAQHNQQIYAFIITMVGTISCAILIFNLLLHVILRGLWIGALGLRYVSGDIDYDYLKYSKKFTSYLKRKVGSFDKYIANLETYCSVIFAISFLLVFYVIAFTIIIVVIALIASFVIDNEDLPGFVSGFLGIFSIIFILIGSFLTIFDFLTQGWLKKKEWISKIYFPIYWVFSFLTLSFLYRPLVYNFLDIKFGKRLSFSLIPIYILILILTSLKYVNSNYLDINASSSSIYANSRNYEDLLKEGDEFIENVAIPSKVISDPFLKIFVVFSENIEDRIFSFNEELRPEEDKRGLRSNIRFTDEGISFRKKDSITKTYLNTFNAMYMIEIDTTKYVSDFILTQSQKADLGFETFLSIKQLEEGKHMLHVNRKRLKDGDTIEQNVVRIPFWYFKD